MAFQLSKYKKFKKLEKTLACFTSLALLLGTVLIPVRTTYAEGETTSLTESTFSSGDEAQTLNASKAFDGNMGTRWASTEGVAEKYVGKTFASPTRIKSIKLFWERPNAKNYYIEVKKQGSDNWQEVHHTSTQTHKFVDIINLNEVVEATALRVRIADYATTGVASNTTWDTTAKINKMFDVIDWSTVSLYEVVISDQDVTVTTEEQDVPVTENATITLSGGLDEESGNGKARMIDGEETTRWATNQNHASGEIKLELAAIKKVHGMRLLWDERVNSGGTNIRAYDILGSVDGALWSPLKRVTDNQEENNAFSFTYPQDLKFIKLVLRNVSSQGWRNVSLREWEIYSNSVSAQGTLPVYVNNQGTELVWNNTDRVSYRLLGTNAENIVESNGKVHQPLVTTNVTLLAEETRNGRKHQREYVLEVQGKYPDSGEGAMPRVIPAVQQYHNSEGTVSFGESVSLIVEDESFRKAALYYQKDVASRGVNATVDDNNANFKIKLKKVLDKGYLKEGYYLKIDETGVEIQAESPIGAYYGLVTLLHLGERNIQKTEIFDYPMFKERKFSLDTGRKFFPMPVVREMAKNMAYYKLNTFQLHLNDNYIWLEQLSTPAPDMEEVLRRMDPGFRIETSFVGENGIRLTSKDHYTKAEFRDLVKDSFDMGVEIVPEIDSPGHAAAFVKMRPELMYPDDRPSSARHLSYKNKPKAERAAMLNLDDPRSEQLVKEVFTELVGTEQNPGAFYDVNRIHIGTDEYYGNAESYRRYVNNMLTFVRDELHKTPKFWGSLGGGSYSLSGTTPVTSDGVEMDIWSLGWNSVNYALEKGYKIVNILDVPTYSVPAMGTIDSRRGGYTDFINPESLFNWNPANFRGNSGPVLSLANPAILGGGYAVWNDKNTDIGDRGLTSFDIFDRFFEPLPVAAQRTWNSSGYDNYRTFRNVADQIGYAPLTDPKFNKVPAGTKVLDLTPSSLDAEKNHGVVAKQKSLAFNGTSYLTTDHRYVGHNATLNLVFKTTAESGAQPLFKTDNDVFFIRDEEGYMAYHYDGRDVQFEYQPVVGEWTHLKIITSKYKTLVFVNGREVEIRNNPNKPHREFFSFLLPIAKIGEGFTGNIGELKIEKISTENDHVIAPEEITNTTANSAHTGSDANPPGSAVDGNRGTIWHTEWGNNGFTVSQNNPAVWEVTFNEAKNLDAMTYIPRGDGSNGDIRKYAIYAKRNGQYDSTPLSEGNFAHNKKAKRVDFTSGKEGIEGIKVVVYEGSGGFASAAEFVFHKKAKDYDLTRFEEEETEEPGDDSNDGTVDNGSGTGDSDNSGTDTGSGNDGTPGTDTGSGDSDNSGTDTGSGDSDNSGTDTGSGDSDNSGTDTGSGDTVTPPAPGGDNNGNTGDGNGTDDTKPNPGTGENPPPTPGNGEDNTEPVPGGDNNGGSTGGDTVTPPTPGTGDTGTTPAPDKDKDKPVNPPQPTPGAGEETPKPDTNTETVKPSITFLPNAAKPDNYELKVESVVLPKDTRAELKDKEADIFEVSLINTTTKEKIEYPEGKYGEAKLVLVKKQAGQEVEKVLYIPDDINKKVETINSFSQTDKTVTFKINHLSKYALVYKKTTSLSASKLDITKSLSELLGLNQDGKISKISAEVAKQKDVQPNTKASSTKTNTTKGSLAVLGLLGIFGAYLYFHKKSSKSL